MARAHAVQQDPLEAEVERAGDALMLLVSRSVWDTLRLQAKAEGTEPGTVLSRAITRYIEDHGSDEAREFLRRLAKERGL